MYDIVKYITVMNYIILMINVKHIDLDNDDILCFI